MNKAKESSRADGAEFLRSAFVDVQRLLETQLTLSQSAVTHDGTMGDVTEGHWRAVFQSYLPNRYAVNSGIIIDSQGHTSDQIDIVIYDLHFTPTLLTQDKRRYIPAEAVYAIFEVKPHIDTKHLKYAANKAESVRRLVRTSIPITHAGGTHPPKNHFKIIAGIVAGKASWVDGLGKSFHREIGNFKRHQRLNCGCALSDGSFDTFAARGTLTISPANGALIFFLFRLLGKLQSLGTVPAIDWNVYAENIHRRR